MIGDMRTVVVTFRPRTGINEDLTRWQQLVDVGLNTARTTEFAGQPAIAVNVRVRNSRRAAPMVARQWVEDQIGGLPIDVLRVALVRTPDTSAPVPIVLTKGPVPSHWPRIRAWATELGFFDLGHQSWRAPWSKRSVALTSILSDADNAGASVPTDVTYRLLLGPADPSKKPLPVRLGLR